MVVTSNTIIIYYWWEIYWTKMYTPANFDAGVHKTSTLIVHNNGIEYTNIRICSMEGRGWGDWGWVANG